MRAGPLRHRVTIQYPASGSPSQNSAGEVDQTWADLATVFASVEPLRGRELIAAQATNSEVTGSIRMRYASTLSITPAMRAKFGTRYFDILAVMNTAERNREIMLLVREGPNDG